MQGGSLVSVFEFMYSSTSRTPPPTSNDNLVIGSDTVYFGPLEEM